MSVTRVQHEIRQARGSEAGEIVRLLEGIYEEDRWFVGDGPPNSSSLARRIRGEDEDRVLFLVATAGRHVVGWLELQRLAPTKVRHVAVLTLAIAREHRREGIGTGLLHRSYAWAHRVGVWKISLNVRENNQAAIRLYTREGFVEEGREERHIRASAGFEANVIMARFLESAPGDRVH